MCEGCCGDVVHALHGIASILHGDMSEASFEERRGQLVHEVEVDGPLLVPGTPGTHGGGTVASMRSSSAGLWVKRTAANSGVRSQKEMTAHLRFPFRRLRAGYSRWGRVWCGLAGGAVCVDGALQATGGFVRRWAPERRGAVVANGVSLPPSAEPGK